MPKQFKKQHIVLVRILYIWFGYFPHPGSLNIVRFLLLKWKHLSTCVSWCNMNGWNAILSLHFKLDYIKRSKCKCCHLYQISPFVFWFLCGSVFTPFWPVEPQKKEELQASTWWHVYFFFSPFSLPTYFMVYKVCIAALSCSFWKFHLWTKVVRSSKQFQKFLVGLLYYSLFIVGDSELMLSKNWAGAQLRYRSFWYAFQTQYFLYSNKKYRTNWSYQVVIIFKRI